MRARLIAMEKDQVQLHTESGKRVAIQIDMLSDGDRDYLLHPLGWTMIKPDSIVEDSGSYTRSSSTARLTMQGTL